MGWNARYGFKSYLNSALWIVPLFAVVVENVVIRLVFALEKQLDWIPWFSVTGIGTLEALNTVETLSISFIVFTFGSILIAIQVATGQLTPRIIATTLLRNNVIRCVVALFIFTMLFAGGTGARLSDKIYHPAVTISWLFGILSVAAFLFLIDYTARLLRPVSIVWRIGEQGMGVIEAVFPKPVDAPRPGHSRSALAASSRTVYHAGTSAIVLAANRPTLVALALKAGCVIEFVPRVGDFVAVGDPLFRIYGQAQIGDAILRTQVAFGPERTIEQDSTFAFRVIVDVAIKALSAAINDSTTAVVAIDQLHRLLRKVGWQQLHDDALRDAEGSVRVVFPTPNWDDFVQLACSEIRLYGVGNFQVARRLRAMIENLLESLPESRHAALLRELDLLDRSVTKAYAFPEDAVLARQADTQGLGGGAPAMRYIVHS